MVEPRDGSLRIRISEEERRMLQAVAEQDGLSASDVIRQFIRREHKVRFGEGKTPTRKKVTRG